MNPILLLLIIPVVAVSGQVHEPDPGWPVFAPDSNPDSLNVERVGEIVLLPTPEAGDVGYGADFYVSGNHALMCDVRRFVHVVDISDPANMRKVAEVQTPGAPLDIKISGNLAAVGVQETDDFGLLILDLSDPANPVELSRLHKEGWGGIHNLFVHGDRIYLAHAESLGMTIVDISDPANPVISGFWKHDTFSNVIHDVFVRDHLAVVSDYDSGLVLLDVKDPDNPELLASVSFIDGMHSAWAEGNYVYCNQEFGGWHKGLKVVDITDPRSPQKVHEFAPDYPPPNEDILGSHNPWARDGLLYWAYYDAGLRVFDLSNPAQPEEVGYHTYPGSAWSVQPHDDGLLYVADSTVGIQAYRFDRSIGGTSTAVKPASWGRVKTLFRDRN